MAPEEVDTALPCFMEPASRCGITDTESRSRKQQGNHVQNVRLEECGGKISLPMDG